MSISGAQTPHDPSHNQETSHNQEANQKQALTDHPVAGEYPYGTPGRLAQWDGVSWTGRSGAVQAGQMQAGRHRSEVEQPRGAASAWGFLGHLWFWLLLGGVGLSAVVGYFARDTQGVPVLWYILGLVAGGLAASAMVVIFDRHLHFRELDRLGMYIAVGIGAGLVAIGLAMLIEGKIEPALKIPFAADLWLSGIVEETLKNLLPFILLLFVPRVFSNPRAGVLMVLVSGAVFGAFESATYMAKAKGDNAHFLQSMVRPLTEMSHPLWAATAAALIWLAAHRAYRAFTWAGLVGLVIAAVQHSLHDGLPTLTGKITGIQNTAADVNYTLSKAVETAVALDVFSVVVAIIAFLILRQFVRELVPPTAIEQNPPRWHPRLKLWGYSRAEKEQILGSKVE